MNTCPHEQQPIHGAEPGISRSFGAPTHEGQPCSDFFAVFGGRHFSPVSRDGRRLRRLRGVRTGGHRSQVMLPGPMLSSRPPAAGPPT